MLQLSSLGIVVVGHAEPFVTQKSLYSLCQLMIRNSSEAIVIDREKEGTETWIEDYGHLGHFFM